jgi:hypothetical protein
MRSATVSGATNHRLCRFWTGIQLMRFAFFTTSNVFLPLPLGEGAIYFRRRARRLAQALALTPWAITHKVMVQTTD